MSSVAAVHTVLGALALAAGAAVRLRPEGGRRRRITGRVYVGAMVTLCLAPLALHNPTPLFQGFGSVPDRRVRRLATVRAGFRSAWRWQEGWLGAHYMWMAGSHIGLVIAAGGHLPAPLAAALAEAGRACGRAIGVAVGLAWGLPPVVGRRWIARSQPAWGQRSTSTTR